MTAPHVHRPKFLPKHRKFKDTASRNNYLHHLHLYKHNLETQADLIERFMELTVPYAPRGFATMSPELQRRIAAKGGRAVPSSARSFAKDHSAASAAGAKGGRNVPPEKRTFSRDPEAARLAGAKGGRRSGQNRRKA